MIGLLCFSPVLKWDVLTSYGVTVKGIYCALHMRERSKSNMIELDVLEIIQNHTDHTKPKKLPTGEGKACVTDAWSERDIGNLTAG